MNVDDVGRELVELAGALDQWCEMDERMQIVKPDFKCFYRVLREHGQACRRLREAWYAVQSVTLAQEGNDGE